MRKLVTALFVIFLLQISPQVFAQQRSVRGVVLTPDQTPVEGASVVLKGKTTGTSTDAQGRFTINAGQDDILVITAVGFTRQEVKVGNSTDISVTLERSSQELGEVVVTAMGIKKERRSLGYSVTDLGAGELMKNKNTNIINSLDAKVPGVNITQFSGSAGAGASITIRGGNSTSESRQNQPLFVIDGIIYDNSTSVSGNTGTDGMSRWNTSYSNRVMDINPEDIASLSVLKGAAAAALYGSRAADGVIIITTKKGEAGATNVSVNSRTSTSWANKVPEAQTEFGNGYYSSNGVFNDQTYDSWGKKLTSSDSSFDNIGNFFQNGIIYDNNVSMSGGSKTGSFYLSGSNYKQTGIVPGTDYDKTTFRFNGDQTYGNLKLEATVAYSVANTKRTLTTSGLYNGGGNGTMGAIYSWPQTLNIKNYINPDGTQFRPFAGTLDLQSDIDNPYWIINMDKLTSKTNRFTGGLNGTYKVTDWWDLTARFGYDRYTTNDYTYIAPGSAVIPQYQNGRLSKNLINYTYITTTVMTNFHKTFGDFDTHLMLGSSTENTENLNTQHWGYDIITAGTISFNNFATTNEFFRDGTQRKRLVGLFGEAGVSYKDLVYLTVTGRNDWSSTFLPSPPAPTYDYFYPSVSGAFVFSQLLPKNNILSYGKLRGSWAQVGKDANPYATLTYVNPPISYSSFTGIGNQYTSGNSLLRPELQSSWEVGGEFRFLNNRIGVDYTYYHSKTKNQIAQPRLSNASGYIFTSINSGSVINEGMEISVNGRPVSRRDFSWDITVNYSYNKGRLGQFLPGVSLFYPTDAQFGTVRAASAPNGGFFLGLVGNVFLREEDSKGNEIPNGRYQVDPNTGLYKMNPNTNLIIGNREPHYIAGINNSFRYKNWNASFLLDVRVGGVVYNGTAYAMVINGMDKRTLLNDRQSVTVTGVNSQTGDDFSQTYEAGQTYTINGREFSGESMIEQYWANYAANSDNFLTSVNWLKLRSLSLSYDFGSLIKNQRVIKGLSVTAVGTNLFTWTNYKGMDPEVSASGGTGGSGSTGIDYLGVPAVSSLTFGVDIKF